MGHWVPEFSKKKTILVSVAVSLSAFIIMAYIMYNYREQKRQDEILEVTKSYMVLQTELENTIYTNMYLLKGYVAYLKSECGLDWRESSGYLEILVENQDVCIRNIATIMDTTIIDNYPLEGNESTIGVDLTRVESQKDMVLRTKHEKKTTFQGPVPLVQGGEGFVIRVPVIREDASYWGQVSIVLDGDRIYKKIDELAEKTSLNIKIYNTENHNETPFYEYDKWAMKDPLNFIISPSLMNWNVKVIPIDGWCSYGLTHMMMGLLCILASIAIGLISYFSMKTNYRFKHNSIHDSLTGLLNRHFLNDYQKLIISAAERKNALVGLLLLDLDDFKNINDTYGHGIGDEVLIETSRILRKVVRTNEAVFRIGGDEFLIIFPMIEDTMVLEHAGQRILEMFQDEFKIKGHDIFIDSSIGKGIFPTDGKDFEEVLQVADKNMYKHKKNKKNY
ncbi:diguanylate cyclase domain-containing protein [Petrocella sp. FN5]|uniref:diguanylate cyclase domain-containing protein n=1 Tax=Petrocella sp. FN5 TaxID=3032002 RepID=UPI0023D9C002|nr:diguanylate cyclase [Petrocella sp. FN5]MDF1617776.1 diguanylate cyclase [Petrocella sp. FN5]